MTFEKAIKYLALRADRVDLTDLNISDLEKKMNKTTISCHYSSDESSLLRAPTFL